MYAINEFDIFWTIPIFFLILLNPYSKAVNFRINIVKSMHCRAGFLSRAVIKTYYDNKYDWETYIDRGDK